jgi:hypothetical protein
MRVSAIRATALVLALLPGIAFALPRAWVSAEIGIDTGDCRRSAPCRTFAYALTQVDAGGEINALDSGGYGEMTITKAVTIDIASGITAGVVAIVADAIGIFAGPADRVVLRGLTISSTTGRNGINAVGFGTLYVERTTLDGPRDGSPGIGVFSEPNPGTRVVLTDCVVAGYKTGFMARSLIVYSHSALIDRCRVVNNEVGIFAGDRGRTVVRGSVISDNNTGVNVYNSSGIGFPSIAVLEDNSITHNALFGVLVTALPGVPSETTLSGNVISMNGTGVALDNTGGTGTATARSRTNNTIFRNGTDISGGSLTPLGAQ